jgi:hypothetical protein
MVYSYDGITWIPVANAPFTTSFNVDNPIFIYLCHNLSLILSRSYIFFSYHLNVITVALSAMKPSRPMQATEAQ